MFKINLGSFEDFQEFSFELKKSEVTLEGLDFDDGLSINLTMTKDGEDSVVVDGDISGNLNLVCGRCLEPYKQSVDTHFTTIYKEKSSMTPDDEENDVLPYDHNKIDLTDCIKDTLFLEIPLKLICKPECAGICPVCGKNQNTDKCKCDKTIKVEDTFKPFSGLDL